MNPEEVDRMVQEEFFKWANTLDTDLGDHPDDYGDWLDCFRAGWNACAKHVMGIIEDA